MKMGTGLLVFEGALHPRLTEKVLLQNENGDWDLISLSTKLRRASPVSCSQALITRS